jgi:hypothetical protein
VNERYNLLILGASYGSLLAAKLLQAGHNVTLVCLPEEAELINKKGVRVRVPVRGREGLVELDSRYAPGRVRAVGTAEVDPHAFDMVGLAMQEAQFAFPDVGDLLTRIAVSGAPCMSIMNMPPLAYLKRLPGVDVDALKPCYTLPAVWDAFDPNLFTLASPDPQAFRPPEEPVNVLQISLPTNFKVARFPADKPTEILRRLQADIEAIKFDPGDGVLIELPVKLKVHDSPFVPLAKWAMLMTGNYRCVQAEGVRSIKEAVHSDLAASKAVYDWVCSVCQKQGADLNDLVPFEKYAQAAKGLSKPSSAARALYAGAPNIERVDLLVQRIARQFGMQNAIIDETVALVDERLTLNRAAKQLRR